MEALADLEKVQTRILQRVTNLELSLLHGHLSNSPSLSPASEDASSAVATATEARLSAILRSNGVNDFIFKRVSSDYYDWTFDARRDVLGAASIHHLCKSIVLVLRCSFTSSIFNYKFPFLFYSSVLAALPLCLIIIIYACSGLAEVTR
mgnify:CR=1 FL=1